MSHAGAIVLAAYEPDPELFERQLRSIAAQTEEDWECIITVDGEVEPVEALLRAAVGDDPRFRTVGDGSRRGFYLNFERGLRAVSPQARWIALSDQDDLWYPEKIATLLPHLDEVALVSGQARLVEFPSGTVLGHTDRRDAGADRTVLNNQFTGSAMVFRSELLAAAVPFPAGNTHMAAHDHWLAVVAAHQGGTRIVDEVLQDYVQHSANVFGDPSRLGASGFRGQAGQALRWARQYEGSGSPSGVARMLFMLYVGWRQALVDTAVGRGLPVAARTRALFGADRRWRSAWQFVSAAARDGYIPQAVRLQYALSWLSGTLTGGRGRVRRETAEARPR